jgi:hypothetical protein
LYIGLALLTMNFEMNIIMFSFSWDFRTGCIWWYFSIDSVTLHLTFFVRENTNVQIHACWFLIVLVFVLHRKGTFWSMRTKSRCFIFPCSLPPSLNSNILDTLTCKTALVVDWRKSDIAGSSPCNWNWHHTKCMQLYIIYNCM